MQVNVYAFFFIKYTVIFVYIANGLTKIDGINKSFP